MVIEGKGVIKNKTEVLKRVGMLDGLSISACISFITLLSRESLAGAERHKFRLLHVENKFIVVKPLR